MSDNDVVKPSEQQQATPTAIAPMCPYCLTDPMNVSGRPFQMGGNVMVSLFCTDCRKMITIGILGPAQPTRIVLPNKPGMRN